MFRPATFLTIPVLMIALLFMVPSVRTGNISHATPTGGYLILNEISPWPETGDVWVEFINPSDQPVTLDGHSIEFLSGFTFTFPTR